MTAGYAVLALLRPGELGLGDVKLAASLGLILGWIGWGHVMLGAFAGFLLGGLFSIGLLATGRATRRSHIPFGPFMLAGALVTAAWGAPLLAAYLGD
jgi:leader peptidase (prepilin peptidase)/N-methyltransferase